MECSTIYVSTVLLFATSGLVQSANTTHLAGPGDLYINSRRDCNRAIIGTNLKINTSASIALITVNGKASN